MTHLNLTRIVRCLIYFGAIHCVFVQFASAINSMLHSEMNSSDTSPVASNTSSIQFIVVGDWGKGGNDGDIVMSFNRYLRTNRMPNKDIQSPLQVDVGLKQDSNIVYGTTYTYQAAIARAMIKWAETYPPSFVVSLGDNFYTNGVSSTTDTLWQTLWSDVYFRTSSRLLVPWYPVFGNHDYGGGASYVQAQLDRSAMDDIWDFESRNYTKWIDIPGGGFVAIVFIDTTTLAPSENGCCNSKG